MAAETEGLQKTDAWLLVRGQRRTRRSVCSSCGRDFRHPVKWGDICEDCMAADIDNKNLAGWSIAISLGLRGIKPFRRYNDPWLYLSWDCPKCEIQQSKRLVNVIADFEPFCVNCLAIIKKEKRDLIIQEAIGYLELSGHTYLSVDYPFIYFSCGRCSRVNSRSVSVCNSVVLCLCSSVARSNGEREIQEVLLSEGINFIPEYPLSDLGCERNLRADFFLPNENLVIEYDGEQHFKPVDLYGGEDAFIERKKLDKEKDSFLFSVGVDVLRVSYKCKDVKGFIREVVVNGKTN